jgi:sporulation protein YlmC with PRC-barrel domain
MCKQSIYSAVLALGLLNGAAAVAQEPPQPSTHPAEGTAADRARPGETPTQGAMPQQPTDPRPSTSQTEGTAADRTPPGQTQTTQDQAKNRGMQRSEMVGASVVTANQAPLGQVVDVVFNASNQPEFVVIESAGKTTAVPYSVASAKKTENKIVIDESRLRGAPKLEQGAWRESDGKWKKDATRYWDRS